MQNKLIDYLAENSIWKNLTLMTEFSQPLKTLNVDEISNLKYAFHRVPPV